MIVLAAALAGCGSTSTPASTTGPCAMSVSAYCSTVAPGVCTWPGPTPSPSECPHTLRSTDCGGTYDAVLLQGVDTGTLRYYDHTTGALVAVVDYSVVLPGRRCEAGPAAGFGEPSCPSSSFAASCPDGGS